MLFLKRDQKKLGFFLMLGLGAHLFMNHGYAKELQSKKNQTSKNQSNILGQDQVWGMTHQKYGVKADQAQELIQKKCSTSGVVVAVIDTGIDRHHEELKNSLWKNSKEIPNNGKDDDKNGFVDDVHGWDFATKSGSLMDNNGHGTHISGIISATGKGSMGFKGVCPGVRIMSLRYYNESASGLENLKNSVKAIEYAIKMKAHIINYSGGGTEPAAEELAALKLAEKSGILVVAAAGNEHSNADHAKYYPAAYPLNNIISVTAIDMSGQILPTSNWGIEKVHVAAPGNSILSTLPRGGYGYLTGTSQATAFVTGVAAMLLSQNKGLKATQLKKIIEESVTTYPHLVGKAKAAGVVNAVAALKKIGAGTSTVAKNESSDRVLSSSELANTNLKQSLIFDNENRKTNALIEGR